MVRRLRPGDGERVTCLEEGCDFTRSSASNLATMSWNDHAEHHQHYRARRTDDYGGEEILYFRPKDTSWV